jgi:hypothetical protein
VVKRIAVLVPCTDPEPRPPGETPLSACAPLLRARGIELVFGPGTALALRGRDVVLGPAWLPEEQGWRVLPEARIDAAYVRTSSLGRLREIYRHAAFCRETGTPLSNPPELVRLCRDKLATTAVLRRGAVPCPPTVAGVEFIPRLLRRWGEGFLKPRYGARGRGVFHLRVLGGNVRARSAEGEEIWTWRRFLERLRQAESAQPQVLQQAVPLPPGPWRGLCLRSLVQRDTSGRWVTTVPVVRISSTSPVANVAGGAQAVPLAELHPPLPGGSREHWFELTARCDRLVCEAVDRALGSAARLAVEMGIDYVPDRNGRLHCIEINDTPQGRLGLVARPDLPPTYSEQRRLALLRPILYLAGLRL